MNSFKGCGVVIFLLALLALAPFLPIILSLFLVGIVLLISGVLLGCALHAAWRRAIAGR